MWETDVEDSCLRASGWLWRAEERTALQAGQAQAHAAPGPRLLFCSWHSWHSQMGRVGEALSLSFLVALHTHRMTGLSQAHSWVDSMSQTSKPVHPGAFVGEPGAQIAQPELGRGLSGNQLFSLGPTMKKRKGLKVRETHSQATCLSSRLDTFFLF